MHSVYGEQNRPAKIILRVLLCLKMYMNGWSASNLSLCCKIRYPGTSRESAPSSDTSSETLWMIWDKTIPLLSDISEKSDVSSLNMLVMPRLSKIGLKSYSPSTLNLGRNTFTLVFAITLGLVHCNSFSGLSSFSSWRQKLRKQV